MKQFQAALFDMDGTILDSMHVWADVDRAFFEKRRMPVPENYAQLISGMSFRQTAVFTKELCALEESVDEILDEWNRMCEQEYRETVPLKPGAKEYLEKLKRDGIFLAVATALPEHLYRPALQRNGVLHLFSAFATTSEAGESKKSGQVYRLAAERLGVPCADCCVFEDICEGIEGAKSAGMQAILVYDWASKATREKSLLLADGYIETFEALL